MTTDDHWSGGEDVVMGSTKLKIGLLVAGHFIAGIFLAWADYKRVPGVSPGFIGLFALVFSEAGLLGIWGALGTSRAVVRLATVLLTTGYLCTLTSIAETDAGWGVEVGLGALTLPQLLQDERLRASGNEPAPRGGGRAKSCILIYLCGYGGGVLPSRGLIFVDAQIGQDQGPCLGT
jgi:hypothetical protein